MYFICEIVPSTFLTPLRRALAHELAALGFVQIEIAQALGVSQPVVSSYLKDQESSTTSLTSRPAFKQLITNLRSKIIDERLSSLEIMETICQECQNFRTAGPLCDIHRKTAKLDFPVDCNICFPSPDMTTAFDQKLQVTKELYEEAMKLVGTGVRFSRLIPEIGCQFVYALEDSLSSEDIVSFPGRIVKVKEKGKIVASPEFGQGAILAQILLYFRGHGSAHRALISIRKTDEILEAISTEKLIIKTSEADKNWETTLQQLPKNQIPKIDAIADSGGVGFEPILYFFGSSPSEIVSFLISKF